MVRILLVDDDEALRTVLHRTLVNLGHEVIEACNGREALALHEHSPADIVLTDLIMPEKEGVETIMEFRKKHTAVRIIAMSGGGRDSPTGYLRVAKGLGADQVLQKPFTSKALAEAIKGALERT